MKKNIAVLLLLFAAQVSFAQDSTGLKLSLLTCAPGEELYSIFGHSAIRIQNPQTGLDEVYNYGMFSFSAPNFYTKFVRGKLNYWLGKTTFERFVYGYQREERAVIENELLLTSEEKRKVIQFLNVNLRKANRFYKYDFFFDNCSTRIRDVLESVLGNQLVWSDEKAAQPTFDDLLNIYLVDSPWNDFGIDLILGKPTYDKADFRQQMFLPDFLKENMGNGTVNRNGTAVSLLGPSSRVIDFPHVLSSVPFYKRPWFLLSLLFVGLLFLSWKFSKAKAWKIFDFLILFLTGLSGCLFLFMWLGTDHQACFQNWNMLWAFPLNIFASFLVFTKGLFIRKYKLCYGALLIATIFGWYFWPQDFNPAFLPLMGMGLLIAFRELVNGEKGRASLK